jgi:glycogen debranching enzyme
MENRIEDIIQVNNQFYVLATSSLADQRVRVLRQAKSLAVFDIFGDILPTGQGAQGIYQDATRFLSTFEFRLGKDRPLFLNSMVKSDNTLFTIDLMNHDTYDAQGHLIPRGTLHIFRSIFLIHNVCYQRLRLSHFGQDTTTLDFSFRYGSDFADMFEIRGMRRKQRGKILPPEFTDRGVKLAYDGLDGKRRETQIHFFSQPTRLTATEAHFSVKLKPKRTLTFFLKISCGEADDVAPSYKEAYVNVARTTKSRVKTECATVTSNIQFNDWLNRSKADLHMMLTDTEHGPYPYAGVPWFNSPFGRDGLITALQALWINPRIAKGVLAYLSTTQSTENRPEKDAEPGKILHELRNGEMVALGEVPFEKYYGSVDSTPLYLMLAAAYYQRTGDLGFINHIWPNLEAATLWLNQYGDTDGDGFVEYFRRSTNGLVNQGWKDSNDSVSHANGDLAQGPIALCEVQGYVYAGKMGMAQLCEARGDLGRATTLRTEAASLQAAFQSQFWCEDLGTYALALDGNKQPCRVRASNAGHCLYTGIASKEHAQILTRTLLSETMFSGWGIRTLADSERRYNPMSYHNGSIWPHDNAIIAMGMSRYGFHRDVIQVFNGMFSVSRFMDLQRLPELFCGFERRVGEGPTLYPVACSPQAWAAGAVFMLLKACLGLSIHANNRELRFHFPLLPKSLPSILIKDLEVNGASVDLTIQRHATDVGITIEKRTGEVSIVNVK